MKTSALYPLFLSAAMLCACSNGNDTKSAKTALPRPGTVIAAAEQPITGDPLNKFIFSVKVIADSNVSQGVYDIAVDYGPNNAQSKMTMPKGGESLIPAIRKANEPYTYIIGFHIPNDTTFYDYMQISSDKGATKMLYIKAYSL